MQNFAINGGLLNGDPEVWIDNASAKVVAQAAGVGMIGLSLIGNAPVRLSASLSLAYLAKLNGSALVRITANGLLTNGLSLAGESGVQVKTGGDFVRWAMLEGFTPTVLNLNGDLAVVPSISATFAIVASADLDLRVATGQKIAGYAPVVLSSTFQAYSVPSTRLSGTAVLQFAGIGKLSRITKIGNDFSVENNAEAFAGYLGAELDGMALGTLALNDDVIERSTYPGPRIFLFGEARHGAKIRLEGKFALELYARGSLTSWRYIFAGGSASIAVMAISEKHGTPNIPSYYVAAPSIRALRVAEESRRFIVPAERRV